MSNTIGVALEDGRLLCDSCFLEVSENTVECPHCGYRAEARASWQPVILPLGAVLADKYIVGKMLGMGGFGITYLAYDRAENRRVAIKEYFPSALSSRTSGDTAVISMLGEERSDEFRRGAQKFYEEAERIACFDDEPSIIHVYEFFYQNNTAYYVMEYLDGQDLAHYIMNRSKEISVGSVLYILDKVSDALTVVHNANFLHRDIAPDNIFVCRNGEIKLIDFGAARQYMTQESQSMSVIVKMGFAPIEQYQKKGKQGPWTDIYALGATAYYMLTGKKPDDAFSRSSYDEMDYADIPAPVARLLKKMLAVSPAKRYQTVHELKRMLSQIDVERVPLVKVETETAGAQKVARRSKKKLGVIFAAAALALGLAVAIPVGIGLAGADAGGIFSSSYSEGLEYRLVGDAYEVQEIGSCTDTDIVIPSEYEGLPVTAIGSYAFKDCDTLRSVTIPDSVTDIGDCAFWGCASLTDVRISETLQRIGLYAFYNCKSLARITIPGQNTVIGGYAFEGCSSLKQMPSLGKVTSIAQYTFRKSGLEEVEIPDGITVIGEGAFYECPELFAVHIPSSVRQIDPLAFAECDLLTTIYYDGTRAQWEALIDSDGYAYSYATVIFSK